MAHKEALKKLTKEELIDVILLISERETKKTADRCIHEAFFKKSDALMEKSDEAFDKAMELKKQAQNIVKGRNVGELSEKELTEVSSLLEKSKKQYELYQKYWEQSEEIEKATINTD